LIVFPVALLILAVWPVITRFEGTQPVLTLSTIPELVGQSTEIPLTVFDRKSGLRKIWVGILKDGTETVLYEKTFPKSGILGSGTIKQVPVSIEVKPGELGLSDGLGILRIAAWDYSWRRWWHGNSAYNEYKIRIDTRRPEIDVLTRFHNIAQGGACLAAYRLSEACNIQGITVGDNFFPGHSGYVQDDTIHLALFALRHDQGTNTQIFLTATDFAGNTTRAGLHSNILRKTFATDTIAISDKFLNWKMPEFAAEVGSTPDASQLDAFLKVNRELRSQNFETIKQSCQSTDTRMHWNGAFLQLPRSASRARFAEKRTYRYKGRIIDHQTHLGIDLASLAQSPVPVANTGRVAFTGGLGIYGKTVIIDHGFGLFSLYAHLSRIQVDTDRLVTQGDIIGNTGMTGMAGGDHLHFSILIHNTFVNPLEWLDAQWIQNNIANKMHSIKTRSGHP